jgi:hypothetical protein
MKKIVLLSFVTIVGLYLAACGSKRDTPFTHDAFISSNLKVFDPNNLETPPREANPVIVDLIKSQKIERKEVLNSFKAMQTAFKNSYIGYNLKSDLIGEGGNKIFNSCNDDIQKASSKLSTFEYYDLVIKCLARFKDTHFSLGNMIRTSHVLTAISNAELLEGKLYIESNRPNLIKRLEEIAKVPAETYANFLKPGTEIITIDGLKPLEAARAIKPYVSASTEQSRLEAAIESLFTRAFFYPRTSEVAIVVRLENGMTEEVILPWLQLVDEKNRQGSPESRLLLQEKGILRTSDISSETNITTRSSKHSLGFDIYSSLKNKKTFNHKDGDEILSLGLAQVNSNPVCYMNLSTFSIDKDENDMHFVNETVGENKIKRSFFEVIKTFLSNCDAFSAPLVFDLRINGGGNPEITDELITLLTKSDAPKVFGARSRLIENGNLSVINGLINNFDQKNPSLESHLELKSFTDAVSTRRPYSDWLIMRSLKNELGVFNQKVVALISYSCVSACEGMANRLKVSARATLLGTPTSGTGFGFSTTSLGKAVFRDPLNLLEIKLPNHAFQAIQVADESKFEKNEMIIGSIIPFSQIKLQENNPVKPDILVEYKLKDLTDNFSEYKKAIEAALK